MKTTQISELIQQMSLEEKIGQLLMIGFFGKQPSGEVIEMITKRHIGSVIFFSRNLSELDQIRELCSSLQEYASGQAYPLLLATDQEGGVVTRLYQGTVSPGNMGIAATGKPLNAYLTAQIMAKEMQAAGLNMTLGPVLDVNFDHDNSSLGVRCFADDQGKVAEFGYQAVRGFNDQGLAVALKHFPGIGSAKADSHLALATVKKTACQLWNEDLYPFRICLNLNPAAVMLGHVHYTSYNPREVVPSSLSSSVVFELLRGVLGYDGVVMTDDLNMKAVNDELSVGQIAEQAILAGVDLLTLSHYYDKQNAILDHLLKAVASGRISEERIDESVSRILLLKQTLPPFDKPSINLKAHHGRILGVAREAVTHYQRAGNSQSVDPEEPVTVVAPVLEDLCKVEEDVEHMVHIGQYLSSLGCKTKTIFYSVKPSPQEIVEINSQLAGCEQIIVCTYNMHLFEEQKQLIKSLGLRAPRDKVVALRNPYDLGLLRDFYPELDLYATYGYAPVLMEALAGALLGHFYPTGSLPVSIN